MLVTQSYPTLCDPTDCSPPGSSAHRVLQARITGVGYYSLLQWPKRLICYRSHGLHSEGSCTWSLMLCSHCIGFPDSSVWKESACNAGDAGSITGLGRSTGEGTGYPLQYSWATLVAQLVKNPPAMQETLARFLGWEDLLEKEKATHSSTVAWRIP